MGRALPPVALVDESNCIGCALCLPVCPTDAIVGAPKFLHTVIAADCTGCEKCLPVCPTDCISMQPRQNEPASRKSLAGRWRALIRSRKTRLAREKLAEVQARKRSREALRK